MVTVIGEREKCRTCEGHEGQGVEVDISADPAKRAWLVETTGKRTVPQVFIKGEPVGGSDDLHALDRSGELAKKLGR